MPIVQILSLANTTITHGGLVHLEHLQNLESVSLYGANVTDAGESRLRQALPDVEITLTRPDTSEINPFTGEPFDSD